MERILWPQWSTIDFGGRQFQVWHVHRWNQSLRQLTIGQTCICHIPVMLCISLPLDLCYCPENIFLVGIAPSKKEPCLEQVNFILRTIIEQLKVLWSTGLFLTRTARHPQGRLVFAGLLPFFADLPALRRTLGFASPNAHRMCSFCLLTRDKIKNIETESWPLRNLDDHRRWARKSREATNQKTRKKILRDHGVRYSALLELPYWNILEYHVVDAMHNLLLGILKWQTQRFWLMSDVDDEKEPAKVSRAEVNDLIASVAANPVTQATPPGHEDDHEAETSFHNILFGTDDPNDGNFGEDDWGSSDVDEEDDVGSRVSRTELLDLIAMAPSTKSDDEGRALPGFRDMQFGSTTDPSDEDFLPTVPGDNWNGRWVAPPEGKIIFDSDVISHINRCLKRIHIPTYINRAIPILGKASFGRLKADEWRNLFVIQLPLILPLLWNDGEQESPSLLHNFAHLVSLVTILLKQSTNSNLINQ